MAKGTLAKMLDSIDILLAGFVVIFLQSGSFKAFGVLFDDIVAEYNTSNTYAGWALTFQASAAFVVAGISGPLLEGFQNRTVGAVGGFLFGLGFVLNGLFGETIYQLFLLTGVTAIGGGLLYTSLIMTFLDHFDKETFPVAYVVRELFQYVGITVIPVLVDKLRRRYGLFGSYLIMGALLWNCMVSGVMMRPAKRRLSGTRGDDQIDGTSPAQSTLIQPKEPLNEKKSQREKGLNRKLLGLCSIAPAVKHPPFALYVIIHSLFSYSFAVWAIFLVPFGTSHGLPSNVAVLLSTAGGVGGFLGKIVVLIIFWYNRMNVITSSIIPATICIVSLSGYIFFDSFWKLAMTSIFCGFSLGYADAALNGILPRYVCELHLRQSIAMGYFISGAAMQLGGIVSGAVLDSSGSFSMIFGIMIMLNIVIFVLAIAMHKMDRTKNECQ